MAATIFDITLVSVVTGKQIGLTPIEHSYRLNLKRYSKLLFEREIETHTPVSKSNCQSQKLTV